MRAMLVALFLSLPILCYASQANSNANPSVDKVLVVKSERALHLMHRGEVVKSYRVSLGKKSARRSMRVINARQKVCIGLTGASKVIILI